MLRTVAIVLLIGLSLSGCSTQKVDVTYDPSGVRTAPVTGNSRVSIGTFSDKRGQDDKWLGAIRGGFGQPLKTLETDVPVSSVVASAFEAGLDARNLLSASEDGSVVLSVEILRYDCSQYVRREAHADFDVRLIDRATGQTVYQRRTTAEIVDGSLLALDTGVFASVEDLRVVANDVLQQAVDTALEEPGFIASIEAAEPETSAKEDAVPRT